MTNWLKKCAVLAAAAGMAMLTPGVASWAGDPALAVSGMRVAVGHVEFYLAARDLPAGAQFGKAQVSVSVDGTVLPAHSTVVGSDQSAPTRTAMLLVDVSGSMKGSLLAAAKAAALAYLAEVPPDVQVGVIAVSTTPEVVVAPTTNRKQLENAVRNLHTGGRTALFDSVAAATAELAKSTADDRRMILLTDGSDSASTQTLADVTAAAVAAGVPVDTVGFHTNTAAQAVLKNLATATSGRVYTAADDQSLASAFQAAAGWFGTQLDVTVDVPASLSGRDSRFAISAKVGTVTVQTTTPVRFAVDPTVGGAVATDARRVSSTIAYPIIGGIVFLALVLVGLVVFAPLLDYSRHRRRVAQLEQYAAVTAASAAGDGSSRSLTEAALAATEQVVRARGMEGALAAKLDQAGMRLRPHEWVLIRAALTVSSLLVFSFLVNIPFGIVAAIIIGVLAPLLYQSMRINSRRNAFATGLPDALQLVVGSLRSGFSLSQALTAMAQEMADPLSTEFGRALAEARLGVPLEDAIGRVADRVGSEDLKWVVVAIRVQREVGGNLAEVLTRTIETMREREAIRGQVKALAAEGKLSAYILVGLPLVISAYMVVVRPDYIRPLYTEPLGIVMLLVGAGLLSLGAFWMSRAIKVEV